MPEPTAEPAPLRRLRRLVTLLTLTLIFGMITITGLLAWRLSTGQKFALPEEIALPAGEVLISYAASPGWTVVITRDRQDAQKIHIIPRGRTEIHQTVRVRTLPD